MSKGQAQCTLRHLRGQPVHAMLNHLLSIQDIEVFDNAPPATIIAAQQRTADWLAELGVRDDQAVADQAAQAAREAFEAVNKGIAPTGAQRDALLRVKSPAAVRHLTGMLTAYDWEFVEQAKEMRAYAVAQIMEETRHPDPRIRLKALQMLGNVTEVGLYTTRVEVTTKDASEEELEARLKERLKKFLSPTLIEALPADATGAAAGLPDMDTPSHAAG